MLILRDTLDAKEAVLDQSKHLVASYVKEINDSVAFNDNSIAVILVPLQAKLLEVKHLLSEANYREWFRSFVDGFEGLLIRHVILEIRIDAKLGNELQNHLGFVLPRLFHSFGLPNAIYLQKLYQYLTVCSLNAASCILLKAALQDQSENVVDNVLADMNLTSLTRNELEALLQRRNESCIFGGTLSYYIVVCNQQHHFTFCPDNMLWTWFDLVVAMQSI
uniref:Uncharacterized protein n=1 Tax=Romanomermis culicivorax TaxID=13658 RepID=A0A915I262_ROMCU